MVKNSKSNLSNGEHEAMKHLAKQTDMILTTADKAGPVVIMHTENYMKEAYRQLSDKNNYKILQTEPTLQHSNMVNDKLDRFKNENLFCKTTPERLKVRNPKTQKFYITPKIHEENNPGRPVIN